jgi:hypothetical protein
MKLSLKQCSRGFIQAQ